MDFWQHLPEKINPIIFTAGPLQFRWYGFMYVVAFSVTYLLLIHRIKSESGKITREVLNHYFSWLIGGVLLGGRLGYIIFYDAATLLRQPLAVILPFSFQNGVQFTGISGMSYHGGLIGVVIATLYFARRQQISFWDLADLLTPVVPIAYTFGRLGNFLNGELYGRVTSVPWGMYFPIDSSRQLRHPSQLYEALFEGIFLFIMLWSQRKMPSLNRLYLPLYLLGYGFVRFFIEFVREPDAHLGVFFGLLTMGQILCLLMISAAIVLMVLLVQHRQSG
ncbi:MAG: prolipoprotein diacylglyceryl transferase [Calditrichaeota bacterium]|nr:MAG: prolipoprotein diacylglyceryl transferase [Calditrichota bacterium]